MVRYILIFLAVVSGFGLRAQTARLIRPLSGKDKAFLEMKMVECLSSGADIGFTYGTTDFYKVTKHDSACSLSNIESLSKKLKGDTSDVAVYTNMGSIYKRLRKPEAADTCFEKAIALQQTVIAAQPHSTGVLMTLSMIYMSMSRFVDSKLAAKQSLQLDPLDTLANSMLPMLHIFCGEFDSSRALLKEQVRLYGNGYYSYNTLPLCDFYEYATRLSNAPNKSAFVNALKDQDVVELSFIRDFYRQDSADGYRNLLYHVSKHLDTELRVLSSVFADTARAVNDYHIGLTARDRRDLDASEAFFKQCLKKNDFKNMYYVYKVLGSIAFLKGEYKKAIPYMKKTIELKPLDKSTIQSNAEEDYHNLESVYYLAKDTLAAEALILDALRIKPAIDSSAFDYKAAGLVYMHRRDYEKAKEMYLTAAMLGGTEIEIWLGLSVASHLLKNEKTPADYLAKAYAADNTDWRVYAVSGLISLEQGNIDDAYFMLGKSLEAERTLKWIDKDVLKKYIAVQ